jgi:hypothetical protein
VDCVAIALISAVARNNLLPFLLPSQSNPTSADARLVGLGMGMGISRFVYLSLSVILGFASFFLSFFSFFGLCVRVGFFSVTGFQSVILKHKWLK